jgi:triacylglycerol lipase
MMQVVDQPGVKYYSFGGHRDRAQIPLFWHFTYDMIRKLEGENDGLVSVKSCAWGEYIETLEAGTCPPPISLTMH